MADSSHFLRDAGWLNRRRVRGYAFLLALGSLGLLVAAWFEAMGPTGSDFLAFWGAGAVTAAGNPAGAYDLALQEQVQTATGSQGWFAFVNPPPYLFVVAPFGLLDYPYAWIAWVAVCWCLWALASVQAFPRLWPLVVAYPGALIAATHAQAGLITGALLVFAANWIGKRPGASGAAIGALIVKPHLALLMPFWLAAGKRWTAFAAAAFSAFILLLASWAVFGTATMLAYAESWQASGALMVEDNADFFLRMSTLYSQVRIFSGGELAAAAGFALAVLMIVVAVLSWRRFNGDATASAAAVLAASALTSPYLFNYDLPFLIFPTLWLVQRGLDEGFRPYEKLILVGLYLAPFATRALAFPLGVNLMPLAAAALLWLVWARGAGNLKTA